MLKASLVVALAAVALLSAGCTRQIVGRRWLGIFHPGRAAAEHAAKTVAGPPGAARQAPPPAYTLSPDDALRQVFEMQARGAFNPATDDRRVQLLNARLRLDPQDVAARLDLAAVYERYGLVEEAFDQYARVMNIAASEAAAAGLGRTARAAGLGADAIPVLAAFLRSAPEAGEAWNELGMLRDAAGDRRAAEDAFRKALAVQPHSDRMHNNLGYNLLLQNLPEAAEAQFRHAVHLNPGLAAARNNLGTVLARRGDLDGARRQFLATGDAATAHNNLAAVLIEAGQYEQARTELVRSLQARYHFAPAIENFKLVQELLRGPRSPAEAIAPLPLSLGSVPAALLSPVPVVKNPDKSEEPENRP